jgi:invasion protein IalB
MQPIRFCLVLAAFGLALAAPATAQEAPAPAGDAPAAAETPATTPAAPQAGETEPAAPAPEAPATEAPAAEAPAGTAPAEGAAAPAPAEGQAANPAQPEVMEIVKDTFGDWQVRCAPDGNECFMYQLALDSEDNPVAEVSILKLPEAAEADAGVTIVSPLGTLLPNGVVLQVDGGERRQYPFAWCSQVGCFSRFGLDAPAITTMKRGNAGTITLVSVGRPEEPVVLDLSLSGFTAAFDSLAVPTAPAPRAPAAPAPAAPAPELPDLTGPAQN